MYSGVCIGKHLYVIIINNTTPLAAWKNLQPQITKLIITLQQPYDLNK
jgi:hypothetical protein